jgi:hypothetical protein
VGLQGLDLAAHGTVRHVQLRGGAREALVARGGHEHAHGIQGRQADRHA